MMAPVIVWHEASLRALVQVSAILPFCFQFRLVKEDAKLDIFRRKRRYHALEVATMDVRSTFTVYAQCLQ